MVTFIIYEHCDSVSIVLSTKQPVEENRGKYVYVYIHIGLYIRTYRIYYILV